MNAGIANGEDNLDHGIESLNLPSGEICAGVETEAVFAFGNVSCRDEIEQAAIGIGGTLSDKAPAVTCFHFERDAYALSGTPERCVENVRGNR